MDLDLINSYLARAREIIGERTPGEIEYDDAIVANLDAGIDIKKAVAAANQQFPKEALKPKSSQWSAIEDRYRYISEYKALRKKLGMRG